MVKKELEIFLYQLIFEIEKRAHLTSCLTNGSRHQNKPLQWEQMSLTTKLIIKSRSKGLNRHLGVKVMCKNSKSKLQTYFEEDLKTKLI